MPVTYKLVIDVPAADKAAGDLAYKEVTTVTRRTFNRTNVLTPVRHGLLRAGNRMRVKRVGNRTTGDIENLIEYAAAVHDGVKTPTVIRPRRRKALRWFVNGQPVFAKKVTIPPRRGRPFMYRALKEVAQRRGYRITT